MPPRYKRPCVKCGTLTNNAGSLCGGCATERARVKEANPQRIAKKKFLYGGNYQAKAKAVKAGATVCFLCGGGFDNREDIEADHAVPSQGFRSPLVAVHSGCNRAKGNANLDEYSARKESRYPNG
jgi:5-methylcytosine-specific restriction endonuclease McrA